MNLESRLAVIFLIIVSAITSWEYWVGANNLLTLTSMIVLPLGFIFLLIASIINGVRNFKELKIKALVPISVLVFSIFFVPLLTDIFLWTDWKVNNTNRIEAIEFIHTHNIQAGRIAIPKGIGYVSRNRNLVMVQYNSQDKLTARFLIKEGFMGGALPDIFLVFHEDPTNKVNMGEEIDIMDENWTIEGLNN